MDVHHHVHGRCMQEVLRLDVAMHHPLGVGVFERVANLRHVAQRVVGAQVSHGENLA